MLGTTVQGSRLRVSAPILAMLSAQSVGRKYERGERSDATIFRDLEIAGVGIPDAGGRDVALDVATFRPDILPSLLAAPRDIETLLAGLPSLSMA